MNKSILYLFLILSPLQIFAQDKHPQIKEKSGYSKSVIRSEIQYVRVTDDDIMNFKSNYFEIKDCIDKKQEINIDFKINKVDIQKAELGYKPFNREKDYTPYFDSIHNQSSYQDYIKNLDNSKEKIGDIPKIFILKYEKKDSIAAFLFQREGYSDSFSDESGVWIAYSEDFGKKWSYYYTGLNQKHPVLLKYNDTKRPLIQEKRKLAIDGCLVNSKTCVKDGVYVVFDIDLLSKDSDNDGLTDVVEDLYQTNKFENDTDGDGIQDNVDSNPRKSNPRTEKTKIYEAMLDNDIEWSANSNIGKIKLVDKNNLIEQSANTLLIITDEKELLGLQSGKSRLIVMTTEEYKANFSTFGEKLKQIKFTPLFKVNNSKNTYKINIDTDSYLLKKVKREWRVERIGVVFN